MWENCIVSEQKVREGTESYGCILAHSMGLGKTLQVRVHLQVTVIRARRKKKFSRCFEALQFFLNKTLVDADSSVVSCLSFLL